MSQYYYVVAALPHLSLESETFPSLDEFLSFCGDWLPESDLRLLRTTSLYSVDGGAEDRPDRGSERPNERSRNVPNRAADSKTRKSNGNGFLAAWNTFESELRNELVRFRSQRLRKDPALFLKKNRSGEPYQTFGRTADTVKNAASESSPWTAERILAQLRWSFIDELIIGHFFDIEWLQGYGLKLRILERIASMTSERGKENFRAYYENVSKQINPDGLFTLE